MLLRRTVRDHTQSADVLVVDKAHHRRLQNCVIPHSRASPPLSRQSAAYLSDPQRQSSAARIQHAPLSASPSSNLPLDWVQVNAGTCKSNREISSIVSRHSRATHRFLRVAQMFLQMYSRLCCPDSPATVSQDSLRPGIPGSAYPGHTSLSLQREPSGAWQV